MVAVDGIEADAIATTIAIAGGLPGVARREAAALAESAASDRLHAAAASLFGATAVADEARASVFDEVLALVAARARRDELVSTSWAGRQPFRALAAMGRRMPTCSSGASDWLPIWRRGYSTGDSSPSSERQGVGSRRSFVRASCRWCAAAVYR